MNFYELLGVTPQATIEEIKFQKYRMLTAYHPDHNKSSFANEMTQRINAAWEILSDPVKRREYDEALKSEPLQDKKPASASSPKRRETPRKGRKQRHQPSTLSAQILQDLGIGDEINQVERNLFESRSGDLYYVKLWKKTLPSFFGLSASILRRYGSANLHLIFYHFAEGFYIGMPFELLSNRLNELSYQSSNQQYKVHFTERDGDLILQELDLPVTPDYLSDSQAEEHAVDSRKTQFKEGLKKGLKVAFTALKIVCLVGLGLLIFLNVLSGSRRR